MSSIYGTSVAQFAPNIQGTQELASSIQSAMQNTLSKNGEDLVLETKSANNVVVKANNTTVATFSANPTSDPQLVVSGATADVVINGNSSVDSVATMPSFRVSNANNSKNIYLGVPGGSGEPSVGTTGGQLRFTTADSLRMALTGYNLQLYNPTASVNLNWTNTTSPYTLNLPDSLGPKNTMIGNGNTAGSLAFQRCSVVLYGAYLSDTTTGITKQIVRSVTIPANTLSENSMIRVIMMFDKTGTRGAGTTTIEYDVNGSIAMAPHSAAGDAVISTRLQYEGFMTNNLTQLQTLRAPNVSTNMGLGFSVVTVNHATNPMTFNVSITDPVAGCTTLRYFSIVML